MSKSFNIWANFSVNDNATKVFKNIGKAGASLNRQLSFIGKNASTVFRNLGRMTAPFIALGGAATVAGMTQMVKSTAQYGDQIANMVERVGWGTKAFQEYAHVARFSDMTTEEFAGNLEKLTRNMGMLRAGSGSLLTSIEKVSPALAKQLKAAKTNEEAFELMIAAIQKVEDPAKKAYLANAAFGKSGLKMVQLANHGAKEIAELRKEAQEMGVVLSEVAVNNAQSFNDAMEQNSEVMRGLSGAITSQVLPVVIPMIQAFSKWVMTNRELIATKVGDFIKNFAHWLKQVDFQAIGNGLATTIGALGSFIDYITSSKWTLIGFIALMNIQTIGALLNVAKDIGGLMAMIPGLSSLLKVLSLGFLKLGIAIMTTPIGWIVAGIAAVVAGFALLWNKCEGFRKFWIGLWEGIKSVFKSVADVIIGIIDTILSPIDTLMKGFAAVKNAGKWLAEKVGLSSDDSEERNEARPNFAPQTPLPQTLQQTYTPYHVAQSRSHSEVVVKFDNLPREAAVEKVSQEGETDLGVEYGYALGGI